MPPGGGVNALIAKQQPSATEAVFLCLADAVSMRCFFLLNFPQVRRKNGTVRKANNPS
jgi:hypothetical protein